jgi:hypothetical protein
LLATTSEGWMERTECSECWLFIGIARILAVQLLHRETDMGRQNTSRVTGSALRLRNHRGTAADPDGFVPTTQLAPP